VPVLPVCLLEPLWEQFAALLPVRPVVAPVPAVNNGAIFQPTAYRPLFEDHRARLVGDTITVQIVEKVAASQSSTSSVDKSGNLDGSITAMPFFAPNSWKRASASGSSTNNFEGKGTTESANTFTGTITATVLEVLPNGHLVVSGEKQIGVNEHVGVLNHVFEYVYKIRILGTRIKAWNRPVYYLLKWLLIAALLYAILV